MAERSVADLAYRRRAWFRARMAAARDRAVWAISGMVWFAFGFVVGALVLSLFSGGVR